MLLRVVFWGDVLITTVKCTLGRGFFKPSPFFIQNYFLKAGVILPFYFSQFLIMSILSIGPVVQWIGHDFAEVKM